ncbi:MAG: type 4a pilus biogenesis protein PilO [Candidatus Marinimicrobia bacterium]|nr:type 4a pilus biogenesis protein PilO [Candidatus Neomarinimicrobiota bacterium]
MKNKFIFYISVGMLVFSGVFYAWRILWHNGNELYLRTEKFDKLTKELRDITSISTDNTELKDRYGILINEFKALKTKIPNLESFAEVQDYIRVMADSNHVEIVFQQPFLEDTLPPLKDQIVLGNSYIERYTVQVTTKGEFLNIANFLVSLVECEKIININELSLESEFRPNGLLTCEMSLFTYIFTEITRSENERH